MCMRNSLSLSLCVCVCVCVCGSTESVIRVPEHDLVVRKNLTISGGGGRGGAKSQS